MIRNTISHFLKKQHELYPSYVGTDAFDLDKYRRVMYEPYREEVRKEDTAKGKKTEELVLSQNLKLSAEAGNILLISDEDYAVTFTAGNILRMGSSFVVNDPGGRILELVQDKLIGYEIVVYDLRPGHRINYDPLKHVRNREDAKLLAEVISARNTEYEVDDLTDKILKMSEGMEDAFGGIQDILKPFHAAGDDQLQARTDGSDAFDTLCIGCERFPQMFHAAGDEFSFEEIGSRLTGLFILTSKEYDLLTEMAICQIVSGINHCLTESHQIRLYLNGAKRIGRALKESKLPFILMDRSVVPVRKIYGEIFLYNISIQVACRGYDYETAGYFALRVGVDRDRRRKVLRRMGVGKGAVTDGPMPMLMKKDDFLNLLEDECIIVTFRLPAIKDKKICTEKQI